MQSKTIVFQSDFKDAEIEDALEKLIREKPVMHALGKQDATNSIPISEDYWRSRVFLRVQVLVQTVVALIHQNLKPASMAEAQQTILESAKENEQRLTAEINDLELEKVQITQTVQKLTPLKTKVLWRKVVQYFVIVTALFDGYLSYDAFSNGGLPMFLCLLYASIIAGAIWIGSKLLSDYAMQATTTLQKHVRLVVGIVIASCLFSLLGSARANHYNDHADLSVYTSTVLPVDTTEVSGLVISVISILFFIVALFALLMTWMDDEYLKREEDYEDMKQRLKTIRSSIQAKKDERQVIIDHAQTEVQILRIQGEYAVGCKKRALALAQEALTEYASAYLLHRQDDHVPPYFADTPSFNV